MINSIAIIILAISIMMIVWRVSKISKSVNQLDSRISSDYRRFRRLDRAFINANNRINSIDFWINNVIEKMDYRFNKAMELNRDITARKKYKLLKNDEVIYENTDLEETRKLMKTLAEADKFYKKEFEYEIQEVYVNEKSA